MTEPDPHSLVLSRRALREPAGWVTAVSAPVAADGATRRDRRRHAGPVIPLRSAMAQAPAAARAVDRDIPATMARRRRAAPEAPTAPPIVEASPIWDAVTRRPAITPTADSSTPVWDAVTRRPTPQSEVQRADDELAQIPAFVMPHPPAAPDPEVTATAAEPPIFRTPAAPAVPAPPDPLAAAVAAASPRARHARRRTRSWVPIRVAATAVTAAALVFGSSVAVTAAVTGTPVSTIAERVVAAASAPASIDPPPTVAPIPPPAPTATVAAPAPEVTAAPASLDPCTTPAMTTALQAGDDAGVITALGGAEAFRAAVAAGTVPCVNLADPARVWVVVDKARPLNPVDFAPAPLTSPEGVRTLENGVLRADASTAMSALAAAAAAAGAGELAVESAYRSYDTQAGTYANHVSDRGVDGADLVSARPGYSEHQSGLAADVVACDGDCGTFDDLAATNQGAWVAAHAWEYGFIVRYEDGHTGVTGYSPEPWHLRYIGVDLATAYHDGGWHTLEEFFGLPAAPGYVD